MSPLKPYLQLFSFILLSTFNGTRTLWMLFKKIRVMYKKNPRAQCARYLSYLITGLIGTIIDRILDD